LARARSAVNRHVYTHIGIACRLPLGSLGTAWPQLRRLTQAARVSFASRATSFALMHRLEAGITAPPRAAGTPGPRCASSSRLTTPREQASERSTARVTLKNGALVLAVYVIRYLMFAASSEPSQRYLMFAVSSEPLNQCGGRVGFDASPQGQRTGRLPHPARLRLGCAMKRQQAEHRNKFIGKESLSRELEARLMMCESSWHLMRPGGRRLAVVSQGLFQRRDDDRVGVLVGRVVECGTLLEGELGALLVVGVKDWRQRLYQ